MPPLHLLQRYRSRPHVEGCTWRKGTVEVTALTEQKKTKKKQTLRLSEGRAERLLRLSWGSDDVVGLGKQTTKRESKRAACLLLL